MQADELSPLSRRNLLTGSAAAGLALVIGGVLRAESSLADGYAGEAIDAELAHRKLRFRTDAGLLFWWLRGVKYGQVGATLTPLYTNNVGTVMRVVPADDGGFDVTSLEMTIPTAVDGSAPLREWLNPYTGETLETRIRPVGPTKVHYRADGSREFPTELGGSRLETEADSPAPVIVGDDVFISEWVRARVYRSGRDEPFVVNDMSHYHGSFAELTDPAVKSASATVSFGEVTSWQSWMQMGDRPGGLTSRTFGRKVADYESLPEVWRSAMAQLMPDLAEQLATDADAALDRPAATFER